MSTDGANTAREVASRLSSNESLESMTLERHEGRIDLRGLRLPEDPGIPAFVVSTDSVLLDLDLRGARVPNLHLRNTSMRNCLFDEAELADFECWGSTVAHCSFRGAKLPGALLSAKLDEDYSSYESVDFSGVDLTPVICDDVSFTDVDFSHANLSGVKFLGSDFTRCTFAGELRGVTFWNESMTGRKVPEDSLVDVDFSRAILRDIEFRNLRLNRITPPTDEVHVIVRDCTRTLRYAVGKLPIEGQPFTYRLRANLATELHWSHRDREIGIWHRESLGRTDEEQAFAIALLREAERACSSTN